MKNLIMGVAKGYDWNILEPFVTSAKKNCPNAELVLFVDDISEFVLQRSLTPATGFIELTIQTALKFAQEFSFNQLNIICSLLIHSAKNNRGVELEFKGLIANFLLKVIEQAIKAGDVKLCFHFINVIKLFDLPQK